MFLLQNDLPTLFWQFRGEEVFDINMKFFPHWVEGVASHFGPRQVVESPALVLLRFQTLFKKRPGVQDYLKYDQEGVRFGHGISAGQVQSLELKMKLLLFCLHLPLLLPITQL